MAHRVLQLESTYLALPEQMYARVAPSPAASPELIVFNRALAEALGLAIEGESREGLAELFAGNRLPEDAQPLALAYAGHQFGNFTMLGDGRAHLIGEHVTPAGERFDLQLKGSGPTPYSRSGDGRAVLGPMLREYLISEAMAGLGIPTTRSLAVVTTGEQVRRETMQPGAVLTRVAASHLRVGSFEFAAATRDRSLLQALLDYTINRHFPDLQDEPNHAAAMLDAVIHRQADLVVHWMRVGFIHGVMNTDNMALCGETIDYGPCAFMDTYDPATVFSSIDRGGRYAYANQPGITLWNLTRLAEALLPLIDDDQDKAIAAAEASLNRFSSLYRDKWLAMMRNKLGLFGREEDDLALVSDLLAWMHKNKTDYTNTFVRLGSGEKPETAPFDAEGFSDWYTRWQSRLERNNQPMAFSLALMRRTNPAVIPRNHKVEEALDAALTGDLRPFHDMVDALGLPYALREALWPYQSPPVPGERIYQTFCGT